MRSTARPLPRLALAMLAVAALASTVACGDRKTGSAPAAVAPDAGEPDDGPDRATPVRLQLNWFPEPEFGGIFAARERGIFTAHGLAVEILQGGAEVPAPQLVAAGQVDVAVLAAEQVLTLRAAGGNVRALYAGFQKAPRVILVKADSPHPTLADLWRSDATVLAQDGMSFVRFLNRKYGGERLRFVPYAGSAAPLLAGAADAMQGFATAEPVQLALDGHPTRVFRLADEGFDPYDVVVTANADFLAREPAAARQLVQALREGWHSYLDDPGPINQVMAGLNRDMSVTVMDEGAAVLPDFVASADTRVHGLGWMSAARWETLAQQLVELGDLAPPVDTAAAFVNLVDDAPAPQP